MSGCRKSASELAGVRAAQSIDGKEPLGVALGFSTVREGLDPILLEELDPSRRRWLNLGTSGSGMVQMHEQASLVLRSELIPDIVIFGLHPTDLVRRPSREIDPASIADVIASLKRFKTIAVDQCCFANLDNAYAESYKSRLSSNVNASSIALFG